VPREPRRHGRPPRRVLFLGIGGEEGRERRLEPVEAREQRRPRLVIVGKYPGLILVGYSLRKNSIIQDQTEARSAGGA
ncbi:MAG: hypothetical protein Q6373_026050, partial [Candidatus Sigynarchaeota archaeon]